MADEQKTKIENLEQQQEEELTPEQAAEAQGGYLNAYNSRTAAALDAGQGSNQVINFLPN